MIINMPKRISNELVEDYPQVKDPKVKKKKFFGNCEICNNEIFRGKYCLQPCNHVFHTKCIINSLRKNPRCPVCKTFDEDFNFNIIQDELNQQGDSYIKLDNDDFSNSLKQLNSRDYISLEDLDLKVLEEGKSSTNQNDQYYDYFEMNSNFEEYLEWFQKDPFIKFDDDDFFDVEQQQESKNFTTIKPLDNNDFSLDDFFLD